MKLLAILLAIYFVQFADKEGSAPIQFSERAIEQRAKWQIPTDQLDYAVSPVYLDSLQKIGAKVIHTSRWMNGATVKMSATTAERVGQCSFVTNVEMTRENQAIMPWLTPRHTIEANQDQTELTNNQLALYNLHPLHEAGFRGQGIVLCVCDGGFHKLPYLNCFDHSKRLGYYDLTDDKDSIWGATGTHGTNCLSTISAVIDGQYEGAATEAEYYVMRSEEDPTESPKEMDNLVAALEKADSLGVNIMSISLGYYNFDNSSWDLRYTNMDGRSTRCSRAATIAARKGMLLCVAAGNEGQNNWKYIDAPADADSILSVGAVGVDSTFAMFSSRGPSADGRVKPEVCGVGYNTCIINSNNGRPMYGNGTSFATPLIAGMAACLWSALPDENAMQIRERIIRSGHLYDHPNDKFGYGIPDAWLAYTTDELYSEISTLHTDASVRKEMHHGQVYIIRDGKMFDMLGRMVQ